MKYLLKILPLLYFALAFNLSIAQNFPVRVTPILAPPYTPFLTDYSDSGSDKLTLQIVLSDITIPEYRCKLRLTIEGVNISISTNPNYVPLPLVLSGGVPEILYGSDISEYFKNTNLIFNGITPQEFEKKGNQLPEGIYRFSFEVLDYNRGTVVSNKGNATAWMLLNDPPFVNLPVNNGKLKPLNPQNLVFQWTPRHRGSPNAAFTTEYDVKLVEIWPKGRNPYDAINTSLPIFETTTENTMIVYGPAETPLVLGREYALQIRARDTCGKDLFKNNGYSEVTRFVYGDECPMPSGILTDDIGTTRARIRWQGNGQNSGYVLRYREKKDDAQWFEENTDQTYLNTTGMRPGSTYEYQLCGECEAFKSEYTKEQTFITLAENPNAFVCGNPNALVPIDGSGPLPVLMSNDFIKAGGFDVVVTHATGSNGKFSGDGLATVPWFNGAKVRVTFENITVNKSYQLTSGFINSRWNKDSKLLLTDENKLTENGTPSSQFKSDVQTFEADTTVLIKGTMIASVFSDSEGNIVVQTTDGGSVTLEKGKSYAVADEVGNGYLIDKDGKVTKTTATDAIAAGKKGDRQYSNDPNVSIRFAKSTELGKESKYGFDEKREGTLQQHYQQTENSKWVAWKALSTGQQDFVQAVSEGTTELSEIRFQLEGVSPQVITTTGQSLTLTGKTNGTIEELLAYSPQQDTSKQDIVAGKLNVVSYESSLSKRLVLVAVNDTKPTFNATSLGLELNKIYSQAVTLWEVSSAIQTLKVDGIDANALDDGGSGLLSNYTSEMKQVLNAYLNGNQMADDTYYLFVANNAKSGNKLGYMPRSKHAGFIFLSPHKTEAEIIHTIAHELGHGVFRLPHTFSEEEFIAAQGTTDNLMDYAGGIALDKYQWDYVHNPKAVIGLFEDDEEGAYQTDGHYSTIYLIGKMLGIPGYKDLAWYAESPDNELHDKFAVVKTTWSERDHQLLTHALTFGYHSEEEFLTAVAFINADISDYKEMGRLLHRYGDSFAHTRLEDSSKNYLEKRMYGDTLNLAFITTGKTTEHFFPDREKPDMIYNRPKWYIEYVKNAAELIAFKFKKENQAPNLDLFESLANYADSYKVSLIGIINFHIARLEGEKEFTIPYPTSDGTNLSNSAAKADQDSYNVWVSNTKAYLERHSVKYELARRIVYKKIGASYRTVSIPVREEATFKLK